MSKLILTLSGNKVKEFELKQEQMIIGRHSSSDIQVENLAVSSEHAKIITILNDSFLEDLKSTNGTFVNGVLTKKRSLQNGDVITVGKHKLQFVNENQSKEGSDPTVFVRYGNSQPAKMIPPDTINNVDRTSTSVDDSDFDGTFDGISAGIGAHLNIANGEKAGQLLDLSKAVTTLGRPGVQVAAVILQDNKYYLIHVETAENGQLPTVNGSEISDRHVLLSSNDEIVVAGVKMTMQQG
jgi:hypothetical protein